MQLKFSVGYLKGERGDGRCSVKGCSGERDGKEGCGELSYEPVYPPHSPSPCFYPIPQIPWIFKSLETMLLVIFHCVARFMLMGDMQICQLHISFKSGVNIEQLSKLIRLGFSKNACLFFFLISKLNYRDIPDGPVVRTLPSNAGDMGLMPGQGTKIPYDLRPKEPKHKAEAMS